MEKTYRYISAVLLMSLIISGCQRLESNASEDAVFNLRLENPGITKVTLENPLSLKASERLWRWEKGDIPSVIYLKDGKELTVPAASYDLDTSDPSMMMVSAGSTPAGAVLRGAAFGSSGAFGKSCLGDEDIPSSMVYAKATFSAIGNAAVLPDLTLKHQCSYLLIVPDTVSGEQMTSFSITGKGLKGGSDSQTIRLSFKDSKSEQYTSKWVSICNTASDILISVTADGQTYEMASLADVGKGKCGLYYVRNTSIGVEYK